MQLPFYSLRSFSYILYAMSHVHPDPIPHLPPAPQKITLKLSMLTSGEKK